ncbi:mitochondrial carrier protein [Pseudohyphozyma bogoriensis]|nr:mitochondrial carrier protein [Pseudohyphozyma bogoriensis]
MAAPTETKPAPPAPSELPVPTQVELTKWQKTFDQFAEKATDGVAYLTPSTFIKAIAPTKPDPKLPAEHYGIFFTLASAGKEKVSWEEFVAFQRKLMRGDAEFAMAFSYFDVNHDGAVSFDEFKKVFGESLGPGAIPFDFDAPWVHLYLGKKGKSGQHVLEYNEFTQLMRGLQGERLRQAFFHFDKTGDGYISRRDFQKIIIELARHKLSDEVLEQVGEGEGKVSYSEAVAFHNVIREMDIIERLVREACVKSSDSKISPDEFSTHASRVMRYSTFSPMEVDIIFKYAGGGGGRLGIADFKKLVDPKWGPPPPVIAGEKAEQTTGSFLHEFAKSSYYFALGGVAGALGATAVYPIDLVKTRMQNQRSKVVGEQLYKNSIDCAKKVYRNEGFLGFYRGLPPQLVGVAPEKAIKLTVNDLVRGYATNPDTGKISVGWELLAGGTAGGCQVVFTNPLEIIKIRLQMQGEVVKGAAVSPKGAMHIIKQLGLVGLYKGATACLSRDVPFSAIYFPAYAHLKKDVFHEGRDGKKLGYGEALAAAAIAGMPAAYLTTPFDVIKTRLQTEARKGDTHYKNVPDAFKKILAEEGPRALFKGGPARILRSSPQFGVTLVAYENLKLLFPFPAADKGITSLIPQQEELSRIRARNALKVLLDVHEDFGGLHPGLEEPVGPCLV